MVTMGCGLLSVPVGGVPVDGTSGATPMYSADMQTLSVVSVDSVREIIKYPQEKRPMLVDARFPEHFTGKKLPGAVFLNTKTPEPEVLKALPDKNRPVIVYCSNRHCLAGYWMAARLSGLGYSRVYEFADGLDAWTRTGGETEPAPDGEGRFCDSASCLQ